MRHFNSKFILSGAATAIVLIAVIISGPRNVFAYDLIYSTTGTLYDYNNANFPYSIDASDSGTSFSGDTIYAVDLWFKMSSQPTDLRLTIGSQQQLGSGQSYCKPYVTFSGDLTIEGLHTLVLETPCAVTWSNGLSIGPWSSTGFSTWLKFGANADNNYWVLGSIYGASYPGSTPLDTSTHFISVTPSNATTTATTTTLAQDVYVNLSDLSSTTAVTTVYSNQYCSSFSGAVIDAMSNTIGQGCSFTFTWNVGASGENSSSTPVSFVYGGTWQYTSTIYDTTGSWCVFGYCLFSNKVSLSQVSGAFLVGQPNAYDVIQGYIASSSGQLVSLASSTAAVSSICNPLSGSFSLGSCAYILIIPDASTTAALVSGVSGKFLTYVPLGYVTRFIAIFGSGTTTPLPVFSYTPPAVLGYSQGAITLNPWNLFSTTSFIGSLTSSSSTGSRTLRNIAEPYWKFLWTLILAIAIIGRITGIYPHFNSRGPAQDTATKDRRGFKHVNDETYRYKEQLYKMTKRK